MVNRVVLVGRLTRDPERRTTTSGSAVCEFSIAVQKRMKPREGQPDADFFRVKAWGNQADYVANYLTKGRLVAIDGRLEQRRFTDSAGQNREVIEVVAESVQGLDRPRDDDGPRESHSGGGSSSAAEVPAEAEYDPFADE